MQLTLDDEYSVYMGKGTEATPDEMFNINPFPL